GLERGNQDAVPLDDHVPFQQDEHVFGRLSLRHDDVTGLVAGFLGIVRDGSHGFDRHVGEERQLLQDERLLDRGQWFHHAPSIRSSDPCAIPRTIAAWLSAAARTRSRNATRCDEPATYSAHACSHGSGLASNSARLDSRVYGTILYSDSARMARRSG